MYLTQVKEYNATIARHKERNALESWKKRGYGYPVRSMFYFVITDSEGNEIKERERGYIAHDQNKAVFGPNKEKAKERFVK